MRNGLCKYKDILGKPGTGIHSLRIGGVAIVDVIGTIVLGVVLGWLFHISMWITIPLAFLLGFVAHWLFCVQTPLNKWLVGEKN